MPTKGSWRLGFVALFDSLGPKPSSPLAAFCPNPIVKTEPSSSGAKAKWVTPPLQAWYTLTPLEIEV